MRLEEIRKAERESHEEVYSYLRKPIYSFFFYKSLHFASFIVYSKKVCLLAEYICFPHKNEM